MNKKVQPEKNEKAPESEEKFSDIAEDDVAGEEFLDLNEETLVDSVDDDYDYEARKSVEAYFERKRLREELGSIFDDEFDEDSDLDKNEDDPS